jgi:hypothetical protein
VEHVLRQRGLIYDVGRSMGAHSPSWRPDYSPALVRRELDIIQADLHANAVRLGGRDPRRLLDAANYAASIGLDVWLGPELWNATPRQTLRYITDAAAAAEPLFRRWPDRLTFCAGNELTLSIAFICISRDAPSLVRPRRATGVPPSSRAASGTAGRRRCRLLVLHGDLPSRHVHSGQHRDPIPVPEQVAGVTGSRDSRVTQQSEDWIGCRPECPIGLLAAGGTPVPRWASKRYAATCAVRV